MRHELTHRSLTIRAWLLDVDAATFDALKAELVGFETFLVAGHPAVPVPVKALSRRAPRARLNQAVCTVASGARRASCSAMRWRTITPARSAKRRPQRFRHPDGAVLSARAPDADREVAVLAQGTPESRFQENAAMSSTIRQASASAAKKARRGSSRPVKGRSAGS